MSSTVNERELILDILLENERGTFLNLIIRQVLDKYDYLPDHSRSFIKAVSEGTVERRITLDYFIDRVSSVKVKKMKPLVRQLMRMSLYQLMYMDSVPSSAVINEAVKLAKKRKFSNLSGFVNGVLRNLDRMDFDEIEGELSLSQRYSCPEWIVDMFTSEYGIEMAEKMLASSLERAPLTVRPVGITADELIEKLAEEGVAAAHHEVLGSAVVLPEGTVPGRLSSFVDGYCTVQDAASQLSVLVAAPEKGNVCIDLCAAPGGKAAYLAQLLNGTGHVSARDQSENKTELIEDTIERLGLENIDTLVWDARTLRDEDIESADIVFADLPCSGLGVLGRKSDVKYRVRPEDIEELAALQREILDTAVRYVKKGGTLIYSTCTVSPQENRDQFEYIKSLGLEPVDFDDCLPPQLKGRGEGQLQLLQGTFGCDGFFISKFRKA